MKTQKIQMVKMRAGKFRLPVLIRPHNGRLFFQFPFNRELMGEIKAMHEAKWHGYDEDNPIKEWSVKDCGRNRFQILYLRGKDPYSHYDKPLLKLTPNRKCLYAHQKNMFCFGATRRQCILACEMRTGKTLVAIEIMEYSANLDWVWVGPKSSLEEVKLQFEDWEAKIIPRFITYDRFRIDVKNDSFKIPFGIIFDESTKIKTPSTQRSQAAYGVAEAMRAANSDCFIIEMSGAPAPKSPADWWNQCEVACPGFIREGDLSKFKRRLSLSIEKDSVSGGTYPEHITWFDNELKCKNCGKLRDEHYTPATASEELCPEDHPFEASVNEVSYLYERMNGLVLVKFRKDCMDLPETQYRIIRVEPSKSVQRAANLILKTAPRAITALMLSRELSDGFQYREEEDGTQEKCPLCKGAGTSLEWFDPSDPENDVTDEAIREGRAREREETCTRCRGKKEVPRITRIAKEVACPKDKVLIDLLDEHEPLGRFVVAAGFTASVDRCATIALR
ncbi:hypothetical protein LCGC14_2317470, partial [marine sediment metagenome]